MGEVDQNESSLVGTAAAAEPEADLYVGEYNDYDTNEPNLEIQKNIYVPEY